MIIELLISPKKLFAAQLRDPSRSPTPSRNPIVGKAPDKCRINRHSATRLPFAEPSGRAPSWPEKPGLPRPLHQLHHQLHPQFSNKLLSALLPNTVPYPLPALTLLSFPLCNTTAQSPAMSPITNWLKPTYKEYFFNKSPQRFELAPPSGT